MCISWHASLDHILINAFALILHIYWPCCSFIAINTYFITSHKEGFQVVSDDKAATENVDAQGATNNVNSPTDVKITVEGADGNIKVCVF